MTPAARSLAEMVHAARLDAAELTGLPPTAFAVVVAESVSWRDGSLGCPQPGMMYTQALVPGYRIRLKLGDKEYLYHSSRVGPPMRCAADRAQEPLPGSAAT